MKVQKQKMVSGLSRIAEDEGNRVRGRNRTKGIRGWKFRESSKELCR